MLESDAPQRIECVCSRKPLLARGGVFNGKPFVWIRNMRGSIVKVDVIVESGSVRICCRECGRWLRIRIAEILELTHGV